MMEINTEHQIDAESRIDFFEWAIALGKEKITIITITLIFIIGSIIYSLSVPPIYTAKTKILTSNSQQNSIASALSVASNLSGINSALKTQDDFYISLLQSDTLQNEVIKRLDLMRLFKTEKLVDARERLKVIYRTTIEKKAGLIELEVDSNDPDFSAKMANVFVEELSKMLGRHALATAKQRVNFYERAISNTQAELVEAKNKFNGANEKSGVLSSSTLTESTYNQINYKELQISAMSHFSTAQNPDIRRLEAELAALRDQLFKSSENTKASKELEPAKQVAISSYREIKSLEMILGSLTSQYKVALTEAFSSEPYVQQIEVATPPERRSKPQRSKIVLSTSILGIILGFFLAIIKIQMRKITANIFISEKIIKIKKSWTSRS